MHGVFASHWRCHAALEESRKEVNTRAWSTGPLIMGGKVVYDIPEKVPFLSEPKIRVFGPFCPNSDHEVPRGGVFVRTLLISCKKIAKNLKKLPNDSAVAYSI
jgi:hypothetical protein